MPPASRLHLPDFYVAGDSSTGASDHRCPSFTRSKRRLGRHPPFSRTAPASFDSSIFYDDFILRQLAPLPLPTALRSSTMFFDISRYRRRSLALFPLEHRYVFYDSATSQALVTHTCTTYVRTAASTTCLRSTLMRPPQPSTLNRRHRQKRQLLAGRNSLLAGLASAILFVVYCSACFRVPDACIGNIEIVSTSALRKKKKIARETDFF